MNNVRLKINLLKSQIQKNLQVKNSNITFNIRVETNSEELAQKIQSKMKFQQVKNKQKYKQDSKEIQTLNINFEIYKDQLTQLNQIIPNEIEEIQKHTFKFNINRLFYQIYSQQQNKRSLFEQLPKGYSIKFYQAQNQYFLQVMSQIKSVQKIEEDRIKKMIQGIIILELAETSIKKLEYIRKHINKFNLQQQKYFCNTRKAEVNYFISKKVGEIQKFLKFVSNVVEYEIDLQEIFVQKVKLSVFIHKFYVEFVNFYQDKFIMSLNQNCLNIIGEYNQILDYYQQLKSLSKQFTYQNLKWKLNKKVKLLIQKKKKQLNVYSEDQSLKKKIYLCTKENSQDIQVIMISCDSEKLQIEINNLFKELNKIVSQIFPNPMLFSKNILKKLADVEFQQLTNQYFIIIGTNSNISQFKNKFIEMNQNAIKQIRENKRYEKSPNQYKQYKQHNYQLLSINKLQLTLNKQSELQLKKFLGHNISLKIKQKQKWLYQCQIIGDDITEIINIKFKIFEFLLNKNIQKKPNPYSFNEIWAKNLDAPVIQQIDIYINKHKQELKYIKQSWDITLDQIKSIYRIKYIENYIFYEIKRAELDKSNNYVFLSFPLSMEDTLNYLNTKKLIEFTKFRKNSLKWIFKSQLCDIIKPNVIILSQTYVNVQNNQFQCNQTNQFIFAYAIELSSD